MKNRNIEYKPIYNLRLAGYLMTQGIPIKRIEVNLGRPWRDVYLFENSDKIEELITEYKTEKSKGETENGISSSTNHKGKS